MDPPGLIDSSVKSYMFNTLKQCHENRVNIYYYGLNIAVFVAFAIVVGFILYNCSKNKLTDYDKQQKNLQDQQYVMSKIRFYKEQQINNQQQMSSITNLPFTQG